MIQRIKNWLIKRLGGYTATEYNRINWIQESCVRYMPEDYRHEKLRATVAIPMHQGFTPPGAVQRELRMQLAEQLEPYMMIMQCEDVKRMEMQFIAELVVVKRGVYP